MKIIHCPPGEDPLTYARRASKKGGGLLAGLFHGHGLIIGLVVAMIIGTFTVGPLRPKKEIPPPVAVVPGPVATPVVYVYVEPVLCTLPGGGKIEVGWEAFVEDGDKIMRVRCEDDGTLKEIETTDI